MSYVLQVRWLAVLGLIEKLFPLDSEKEAYLPGPGIFLSLMYLFGMFYEVRAGDTVLNISEVTSLLSAKSGILGAF